MSIFEIIMVVCFGAAWPFSIYKSFKSKEIAGKSLFFLLVILVGYVGGILHKVFFYYDPVVFLYILNGSMVLIDIGLYFRNRLYHIRENLREDTLAEGTLTDGSPTGRSRIDRSLAKTVPKKGSDRVEGSGRV